MEFFHFESHLLTSPLTCFHCLIMFHWLPLSGTMWTSKDLETFPTERHLILRFLKKLVINYESCFHPLAASLQPHCLLPHGIEWQSLKEDLRYLAYYYSSSWSLYMITLGGSYIYHSKKDYVDVAKICYFSCIHTLCKDISVSLLGILVFPRTLAS